jgi:hypothetical protein
MGAIVRLKSENKSDNNFAYAYYVNYLIVAAFGLLSIYNIFTEKYLSAIPTILSFFVFIWFKNLYADFSANSKCKNPHTLQEFLAAINLERPSRTITFMRNMSDVDYDGCATILIIILIFGGLPVIVVYNSPYYFNFAITTFICLLLIFSFYLINAKILDNIRLSNEKVTYEIMQKVESVVFQRPEDKLNFSNSVLESLKSGYITRIQLYEITKKYVFENDRTDMVVFLKKLKSHEEKV